jgi:3-deoxy-7-phosphoheptulonate synthase
MLVVMEQGATEEQIEAVIDRLVDLGFTVHRSTGVVHTVLGGVGPVEGWDPADFAVLAGVKECHRIVSPYKLASRHYRPSGSVVTIGALEIGGGRRAVIAGPAAAPGAGAVRIAPFPQRLSPYAARPGAAELIAAAAQSGLPVVAEVGDTVELAAAAGCDAFAVPMTNLALLDAAGTAGTPVLLERAPWASTEEWLLAAERILVRGNEQVILCEGGMRGPDARPVADLAAIPLVKRLSHLPVLVDASRATGRRDLAPAVARAAIAAGADGLILEVGGEESAQALSLEAFARLLAELG